MSLSFRDHIPDQKLLAADIAGVERLLDKCPVQLRHWEWGRLKRLCHLDLLTLQGHDSKVTSVAFSLDGRRIASGSVDETIKVWDAMTGKETLTLQGHDSNVTSVAFSLDGRRIASGSVDETIKVWDAMVDGLTQDEAVDSTADR